MTHLRPISSVFDGPTELDTLDRQNRFLAREVERLRYVMWRQQADANVVATACLIVAMFVAIVAAWIIDGSAGTAAFLVIGFGVCVASPWVTLAVVEHVRSRHND